MNEYQEQEARLIFNMMEYPSVYTWDIPEQGEDYRGDEGIIRMILGKGGVTPQDCQYTIKHVDGEPVYYECTRHGTTCFTEVTSSEVVIPTEMLLSITQKKEQDK